MKRISCDIIYVTIKINYGDENMDRKNRPSGRKKRIGTGSAKVKKRGTGIRMRKTRPLGGSGSFFGSSKPSSNQNESTSQNYYNSSTQRASED
jgi:hypothetical protein